MERILSPKGLEQRLNPNIIFKNSENINKRLKEIEGKLEEQLTISEIEGLNPEERGFPNYLPGTFDVNGIPIEPKIKQAYKNIVLGLSRVNVFEGGVRGGKDVIGIALFSELIMIHPASTFLVLGSSLEHAIRTVFDSDGFGIFYTIPHGRLTRESIDGAQRVVYRYKNYLGIEKKVLIYGNANQSDYKKYQGFSIGATYVNEGTNQHLKGITEALERMIASPIPVMVVTQNPVGPMAAFYKEFEAKRTPTNQTIDDILSVQEMSKYHTMTLEGLKGEEVEVLGYKGFEDLMYKKMKREIRNQLKGFLKAKERPDYNKLDESSQVQWNKLEEHIRFTYEKQLRGVLVRDIFQGIPKDSEIGKFSWKKVVYYEKEHPNPNNVKNNVDYSYYHLTIYDNKTLTEAQIEEAQQGYVKGTSRHQQRILGIRKAIDSAVWGSFDDDNIYLGDVEIFKKLKTERYLVIDFGAGIASYIGDYEVNFETGEVVQTREAHITPEYAQSLNTTITDDLIYDEWLRLLKQGKKRATTIIDTANLHLRNYFSNRQITTVKADKRYDLRKGKDTQRGFDSQNTSMIGLELVNLGFQLKKIKVSADNCPVAVDQIQSYEYDEASDKTGDAPVIKKNDEACDTMRYLVSTALGGAGYWYDNNGEVLNQIEDGVIVEKKKESRSSLQARIQNKINQRGVNDRFFKRRNQFGINQGGPDDIIKFYEERKNRYRN